MPSADYMREWRKTDVGMAAVETQKQRERARKAAVRRLIEAYPTQWQALFNEELRRLRLSE